MTEKKTKITTRKRLLLALLGTALLGGGGYIYITRFHNPCENKHIAYEAVKEYELAHRPNERYEYNFPSINDTKEISKYIWVEYQYKNNCVHWFDLKYFTVDIDDYGTGGVKGTATYKNNQWIITEDNNKENSK